jgi:hypothetical protein
VGSDVLQQSSKAITGMKPQSKLWKLIPQQSCGVLKPSAFSGIVQLTNFNGLRF